MAKGKYEKWLDLDGLLLLEAWARDGLTDDEIAMKAGINRATLYDWKKKYPDISDALKRGKEIVDVQVENALLKRALGYSYNEDKYVFVEMSQEEYHQLQQAYKNKYKYDNPEASQEEINLAALNVPKTKKVLAERKTKEVVPDTTAQIFWLKNRKPDKYRDKQTTELMGGLNIMNQYQNMTDEELAELAKKYESVNSE